MGPQTGEALWQGQAVAEAALPPGAYDQVNPVVLPVVGKDTTWNLRQARRDIHSTDPQGKATPLAAEASISPEKNISRCAAEPLWK